MTLSTVHSHPSRKYPDYIIGMHRVSHQSVYPAFAIRLYSFDCGVIAKERRSLYSVGHGDGQYSFSGYNNGEHRIYQCIYCNCYYCQDCQELPKLSVTFANEETASLQSKVTSID